MNKFNMYLGLVVDTKDPNKRGRVRVRIPQLHGLEDNMSNDTLPWYEPCMLGSGPDMGTFIIPTEGSNVWVMLPDNYSSLGFYLGGTFANNNLRELMGGGKDSEICSNSSGVLKSFEDIDVPKDVYSGKDSIEPTLQVLYKSIKGHTVKMEDGDEKESMSFLDRIGQVLTFYSPVKKKYNRYNEGRRGIDSANVGTAKEDSYIKDIAFITLKDVSGQVLRLVSKIGSVRNSFVELVSRVRGKDKYSGIRFDTTEGSEGFKLFVEDQVSKSRIVIKADLAKSALSFSVVEKGVEKFSMVCGKDGLVLNTEGTTNIASEGSITLKTNDSSIIKSKVTTMINSQFYKNTASVSIKESAPMIDISSDSTFNISAPLLNVVGTAVANFGAPLNNLCGVSNINPIVPVVVPVSRTDFGGYNPPDKNKTNNEYINEEVERGVV